MATMTLDACRCELSRTGACGPRFAKPRFVSPRICAAFTRFNAPNWGAFLTSALLVASCSAPAASEKSEAPAAQPEPALVIDDGVLHVWTLGDSITVGVEGGFRNDLYDLLVADGYSVDLVGTLQDESTKIADKDHEGHGAYTFNLTREDAAGWLASIPRPDVVLMLLGSNDFAWWTNVTPREHFSDMLSLLDQLLGALPAAAILVATLPPQSPEIVESVHRDRGEMTEEFNALLREKLPEHAAHGQRVFLVDLRARLELEDLYDGIHPTREAHREVAAVWHEALLPILPR
jgi:lysophospholipase L1-like esterase